MGRLTTHVLDTTHGKPAAGVLIWLYRIEASGARMRLGAFTTNADGRCDQSLLEGAAFTAGTYELEFHAGDYFAAVGVKQTEPKFLDIVTVRFGIAAADQHYHVPLLMSPFAYSTYRGS